MYHPRANAAYGDHHTDFIITHVSGNLKTNRAEIICEFDCTLKSQSVYFQVLKIFR
jgi:hypothetical protein